jgi:hypothetical protein
VPQLSRRTRLDLRKVQHRSCFVLARWWTLYDNLLVCWHFQ